MRGEKGLLHPAFILNLTACNCRGSTAAELCICPVWSSHAGGWGSKLHSLKTYICHSVCSGIQEGWVIKGSSWKFSGSVWSPVTFLHLDCHGFGHFSHSRKPKPSGIWYPTICDFLCSRVKLSIIELFRLLSEVGLFIFEQFFGVLGLSSPSGKMSKSDYECMSSRSLKDWYIWLMSFPLIAFLSILLAVWVVPMSCT